MTTAMIIWLIVAVSLSGAMLIRIVDDNKPVRRHLLRMMAHHRR